MSIKRRRLLGCFVGGIILAGIAPAEAAQSLDVKTGLWEDTVRTESHGKLPMSDADMQRLTPQQRATLQKMMAESSKPHTRVIRVCVTQDKLDRSENSFGGDKPGMTCDKKISRHTRDTFAGTFNCTDGSRRTLSEVSYHASDREHVAGTIHVRMSNGANTMTTQGNISARWISADCGATR